MDLTIYGRGDPSIAARFNNGDYFKGIDDLALRIVAAGVKRIEGDRWATRRISPDPIRIRLGVEDLQWWYGAEISALAVNDNALDLFIKPGAGSAQASVRPDHRSFADHREPCQDRAKGEANAS